MTGSTYVVLLPVKPPARGKSRLEVDPARRRDLAAAFALDTARACLAAAAGAPPCSPSPTTHGSPMTCARPGARPSPTE